MALPNLQAYLDGGSLSLAFQALLACLIGVGAALKMVPFKLSSLFRKKAKREASDPDSAPK